MKAIEQIWENINDTFEEYQVSEELNDSIDNIHKTLQKLNIPEAEKDALFDQISDVINMAEKQGFLNGFDLSNRLLLNK